MKNKITVDPGTTRKNKTGGWRTFIPTTNYDKCIACGTCSRVCPEYCVKMTEIDGKRKPITDYDFCKGCGICAEECPVKAISMSLDIK